MNVTDIPLVSASMNCFPLPFHVLGFVALAVVSWATNLHGLELSCVDVANAMDLRLESTNALPAHHHHHTPTKRSLFALYHPAYRLSVAYFVLCLSTWLIYLYFTRESMSLADAYGYIPAIGFFLAFGILLCPYNVLHKTERRRFLQALNRCLFLSSQDPVYFCDVVLADIFTSLAPVLGDMWLSLWMLVPGNSILDPPVEAGLSRWMLPTVMCLPYFVRLRQCLTEYRQPGNTSERPLYNALKYATAFPAIYLAAAQRVVIRELVAEKGPQVLKESWHGEHYLFRLWLLAALVNSLYSFWWDITNDWGLSFLQSGSVRERSSLPRRLTLPDTQTSVVSSSGDSRDLQSSPHGGSRPPSGHRTSHAYGLRSSLHFPVFVYYLTIAINLTLRLTWLVRLSAFASVRFHASPVNLSLQAAEVFRRWLWVFLRVDWEIVKNGQEGHAKPRSADEGSDYELVASSFAH